MPLIRPKPFRLRNDAHDRKVLMARRKRLEATPAELALWTALKDNQLGLHFAFQFPLAGYILDFYCHARHLAIEVDGPYHFTPQQLKLDGQREANVVRFRPAVRFLRFTNDQVLTTLPAVLTTIHRELGYPRRL